MAACIPAEANPQLRHEVFGLRYHLHAIFDNDMDISDQLTGYEKALFDKLKKYKLASSEGLNKHTNRMIRYTVLKDFLFGMNDELVAAAVTLDDKMRSAKTVGMADSAFEKE